MIDVGSEAVREWSKPVRHKIKWANRARVAARMCGSERWVCDLGCGMQYLKAFLPRSTIYLPADLKQWTSDTEICDLDAGNMPTRSLELCDICVMLGVIDHLLTPERAIEKLSWNVEKILISYNSTDFSRQGLGKNRVNAYSLTEIYAMLEGADFCITEQ